MLETVSHIKLNNFLLLILLPFIFEFFHQLCLFIAKLPSKDIKNLKKEIYLVKNEINSITSVQTNLIKHSKLTRKLISLEKDLNTKQVSVKPLLNKINNLFYYLRLAFYTLLIIFFHYYLVYQLNNNDFSIVIEIEPRTLWPIPFFTSSPLIKIKPFFILIVTGKYFFQFFFFSFSISLIITSNLYLLLFFILGFASNYLFNTLFTVSVREEDSK